MDVASIAELGKSMAEDLAAGRHFALITRSRQQEELYIRALYAMFIATPEKSHTSCQTQRRTASARCTGK